VSGTRIGEAGGSLTCGPHATVPSGAVQTSLNPIQISNEFKLFQNPPKFGRSKNDLPEIKKFEIKYGFEDLKKVNNFLHRTSSYSKRSLNQNSEEF
jgi:hypothetical protein